MYGALHGSRSSHHLPDSETGKRDPDQEYHRRLRLAAMSSWSFLFHDGTFWYPGSLPDFFVLASNVLLQHICFGGFDPSRTEGIEGGLGEGGPRKEEVLLHHCNHTGNTDAEVLW